MNRRHILLLDPNDGNRRNFAFLLHLAGYQVTEMGDGDEAINRLALCGRELPPDLLLICPDQMVFDLRELLGRLQQWQLPYLILSDEADMNRSAPPNPETSRTCRRKDVIQTLACHWPTTNTQSHRLSRQVARPQEPSA